MTGDQRNQRNALARLADALVDDILNASDEEVLAEAEEDGIDPAKICVRFLSARPRRQAKRSSLRPDGEQPTPGERVLAS